MRPDELLPSPPADAGGTSVPVAGGWHTLTMGAGSYPAGAVATLAARVTEAPGALCASVPVQDGHPTAVTVTF